jgi:hypothetical protein
MRATCAAVRAGFSRFSAAASSSTSAGVRGPTRAGAGTSAANPPACQARTHRSIVGRETRTGSPEGPRCSAAASARTIRPRCLLDTDGSTTSWITS